jgi:hypothetical protein
LTAIGLLINGERKMKNIDMVNLDDLEPNEHDPLFGWIDKTTGKNYWLIEEDEYLQVSPMIKEDILEVRPMPILKMTEK